MISLRSVVEYLASERCLPRTPGRPGGLEARRYLADRLLELDVQPSGIDGFVQPIPSIDGANLIARVPGNGPLAERHVLIAAHYDACDPFDEGLPGAGDNAAAVAVALGVAERLGMAREQLNRSVVVCLFDAEEPPFFMSPEMGSQYWVDHPTVPLESVDMMICLDLVGHAVGTDTPPETAETVFVLGAELSEGTGPLLDALPAV